MFRRILIATDFSTASRAALFGSISLAARCLAHIEAVHVVTFLEDVFHAAQFLVPGAEWQRRLEKQFEDFFPTQMYPNSTRTLLVGSSIPTEILKYARKQQCDLIVAGTHGRTMGNLLMGSITQQLTRGSEIPVMVVRRKGVEDRNQGYHNILVPIDFSATAMKALHLGVRLANFLEGDLHLVHVVDLPQMAEFQTTYPVFEINVPQPVDFRVDATLEKMLQNEDLVGKASVATIVGDPVQEILAYSEGAHIDFIVMGTHGRTGIERILMGSVTSGVLARSHVPVITISAQ